MPGPLGRRQPSNFDHVDMYPLRTLYSQAPTKVEKIIPISYEGLRDFYNQGTEGACVGFSESWMMSMLNKEKKYAARWLYKEAQKVDEWSGENYDGTSLNAGFKILKDIGHRRVWGPITYPAILAQGIEAYRWARNVNDCRMSISLGIPFVFGIDWHENYDNPVERINSRGRKEYWIGMGGANLGVVRGGHAIVCRGASDDREAFLLTNTWGKAEYPDVWIPYSRIEFALQNGGEAGLITDR